MSRLNFVLEATASGSRARACTFQTLHGQVQTPIFMPVGTQATVRHQCRDNLETAGSNVLLANTYHLLLRPGPEVFKRLGGIHKFMKWNRPVLTDSGGFQIFSLPTSRRLTEEGASFKSHVDGATFLLSPEFSIETQKAIGADIMMALDECVPSTSPRERVHEAMSLTHRWAQRSLIARGDSSQAIFGIVQGACLTDLRKQSAEVLSEMDFDGMAIGGLAVGESKGEREDMTEFTAPLLPTLKPRYLMGVGTPIDLLEAVHRGVDMFDCIIPSALAAQGVAYTSRGRFRLGRSLYKFSDDALDPSCACSTCQQYPMAYLHHLVKVGEPLGVRLIGHHNISFYHHIMRQFRAAILDNTFSQKYPAWKAQLALRDCYDEAPRPRVKRTAPLSNSNYELQVNKDGFWNLKHKLSAEVMHPIGDPRTEAQQLYVNQSRLKERVSEPNSEAMVLWDVGLGAAFNAMAAILEVEKLESCGRPLHIISFENDLSALELCLRHTNKLVHLRHQAPGALMANREWKSLKCPIQWTLLEGDFLQRIDEAPAPDIIFYDPFSFKTNPALWTQECFQKIAHKGLAKNVELFSYTASTAIRNNLEAARFRVVLGIAAGPKAHTTIGVLAPSV